jgi:predicted ATPase
MIKKIGIQNFRIFKEFTEFELKPITILTGTNNSGKSSFTKLLLLLNNGVSKLDFNKGLHNLESFDKVLNWDLNDKKIKIRFENHLNFLDKSYFVDNFFIEDDKNNGELFRIDISNENGILLAFLSNGTDCRLKFNIDHMFSLIYNNKLLGSTYRPIDPWEQYETKLLVDFQNLPNEDLINMENFEEIFRKNPEKYSDSHQQNLQAPTIGTIVLKNTISNLKKDNLLYNIIINSKNATEYHIEELINLQRKEFDDIFFDGNYNLAGIPKGFNASLEYCLKRANAVVKEKIRNHFQAIHEIDTVEITETELGKLLFKIKLFDNSSEPPFRETNYQKTLFEQFSKYALNLKEEFSKLEYISANRASQKRVLANSSEYDIDAIVVDFFNKSQKNITFLKIIFDILEIPGELSVERFENIISIVYLKINDRKIALSDVGFGFSQIIPIILKIVTLTEPKEGMKFKVKTSEVTEEINEFTFCLPTSEKTIIIEEPEANLHPNLQSKLADVFVEIIKYYPEINFIIETHSEYMIRRLQYLTAKREVGTDKSIIYYFNAEKYVRPNEPKVKAIQITSNGNLTDTFGPGFYDESTRLQFDLMKLNQEQKN